MTVMYWPRHEPIPEGWRATGSDLGHHAKYSILIERVDPNAPDPRPDES